MGGLLFGMVHLIVDGFAARVVFDNEIEYNLVDHIGFRIADVLPIGYYCMKPRLHQEIAFLRPYEAVLESYMECHRVSARLVEEYVGVFYPMWDLACGQCCGIEPIAAMSVDQCHTADIGEMRRPHMAAFPHVNDEPG